MPVIQSSKKALRKDRRREAVNKPIRTRLSKALRIAREQRKPEQVSNSYSVIDRAAKVGVIHKNKASRLKSRLSQHVKRSK